MKKLMLAVAIVCAAAMSQAAAIDWKATKVCDPSKSTMTAASGWLGYAVLAANLSTITEDLAKGDTTSLTTLNVGPVKTTSSKGAFEVDKASGSVAGGNQDFYLIVLNSGTLADATQFYVSSKTTATIDSSLDTTVNFGAQDANSSSASNWTAMAPEPTSGLLLLIGMGALALKRKQKIA